MAPPQEGVQDTVGSLEFERISVPPNFTMEDVRKAIPASCFQKSAIRSLSYMVRDFAQVFGLYMLCFYFKDFMDAYPLLTYPIFWLVQGTFFWALFVVGHDCGHGSFSDSSMLNHFVGHVTHTPLFVPFHSWRISHHKHHLNTGNVEKDESWTAVTEEHYKQMWAIGKIWRFHAWLVGGFLVYLIGGMPTTYYSHYLPFGETFKGNRWKVVESNLWILGWCALLGYLYTCYGGLFLAKYYLGPELVFAAWIAIVTYSHHTHPDVPWYRGSTWNYFRGALSTVDRNYGIVENIHHNIGTHMVHHIFMKIPHYHLKEATSAAKPVLGRFYKKSNKSLFTVLVDIWRYCRFVKSDSPVVFFEQDKPFYSEKKMEKMM